MIPQLLTKKNTDKCNRCTKNPHPLEKIVTYSIIFSQEETIIKGTYNPLNNEGVNR